MALALTGSELLTSGGIVGLGFFPDPAFADELPYAVVVVELDEGPRIVGNLVGIAPDELRIDQPVRVVLDRRSDVVALVDFGPR